jgi:2-keto-3-deoxy-6-phosphogluconate aldolase
MGIIMKIIQSHSAEKYWSIFIKGGASCLEIPFSNDKGLVSESLSLIARNPLAERDS